LWSAMRFPFGIESAENLFLLGMSAMLTLDPSCETYRRPYLRAHSRRLRSLVLTVASTDDGLGHDIRSWQV
jgi:hypothetical protein